jgi:hypothetical protein
MRGSKGRRVYITCGADAVPMPDRSTGGVRSVELDTGFRVTQGVEEIVEQPERFW